MLYSSTFKASMIKGATSVLNSTSSRIYVYKGTMPTTVFGGFTLATYASNLLLTYVLSYTTFTNTNGAMHFLNPPAAATASASGTAAWAAAASSGTTTSYVIVGEVSVTGGNGIFLLPSLNLVAGTSYVINDVSFVILG
jgi:hypothetical protein